VVGVGVVVGCDGEVVAVGEEAGGGVVGAGVGVAVGEETGVVVGCEDPPGCVARRAIATAATIATATIIARFLFGPMGRGWLYGKNLFAMFNSGYIDAAMHSLRQNSYECYLRLCCGGEVIRPRGLASSARENSRIVVFFVGIR
jgi:hypothetical protein